jgi:hypothetical protein
VEKSYTFCVAQSAFQLRHVSGCDAVVVCFLGMNINFVAVTRKPAVFLEAFCDKFPHSFEEVSF